MSRRKKKELYIDINTEKEFDNALNHYHDKLICAEIYCENFGCCTALDKSFNRISMEWGGGDVVLLRVLADDIQVLSRLQNQSEPFYMFIVNKRVTQIFRGTNSIKLEQLAKTELEYFRQQKQGFYLERPSYDIDEPTPTEMDWLETRTADIEQEAKSLQARHDERQAERKYHRAELMAPSLESLDFVMYWPHATHAHPELYERWDENNLVMVAREEIELTEEEALNVLYLGDAPINEASMHALLSGPALVICLRCLDPVHIVSLVRRILYVDVISPPSKESDKHSSNAVLPISPYEYYRTFSLTKEQIWQKRREDRILKKIRDKEERIRRVAELQRVAHIARAQAIEAKKTVREQKKMELLKSGKLAELEAMKAQPDDSEDVDIEIPEEQSYVSEESEIEEDPDEEFLPPGLPIPGFYSPPNDIAKANGLSFLFPNLVSQHVKPQPEILPPHVLVMLHMSKREKAIQQMAPFKNAIIHMGIFKANTPYDAKHVAYTVKQFESMEYSENIEDLKLCIMVSTKVDVPLLELMDFHPLHVSRDNVRGEDECAAMFRVDYGDDYPEFEDFDKEEEKEENCI